MSWSTPTLVYAFQPSLLSVTVSSRGICLTELFFIYNDGIIAFAGDQQTSEQWPCFLTRLVAKQQSKQRAYAVTITLHPAFIINYTLSKLATTENTQKLHWHATITGYRSLHTYLPFTEAWVFTITISVVLLICSRWRQSLTLQLTLYWPHSPLWTI